MRPLVEAAPDDRRHTRSGTSLPTVLVGLVAVAAAVLRLPNALRPGQIGFDDGAYGWSAVTMRSGALPYIDVFCGQGPLFLPLLRVADVIGGQATWSPRLLGLVTAAVLTAVTGFITAAGGDRRASFVAMGLVATSGLVFRTTTAIEAEPAAMVFAALAVLVAVRVGPAWLVGVLAGAALSVKSLLVVPALVAVLVVLARDRGKRDALGAAATAAGVALVAALPWGLAAVWEQSVAFHLDAREGFPVWSNVRVVTTAAWESDRLLLAAGAIAVATLVAGLALPGARGRSPTAAVEPRTSARGAVVLANGIWLAGTAAVLAIHSPLFAHHATAFIVPAAVLVALARPWLPALALAAVLVLPGQASRVDWRATPEEFPGQERAIADLERLVPEGTTLITDGPGLGWWAGAATPPWLVDISHVRLDTGYLTGAEIEEAAADPANCAVLVWSARLDGIKPLRLPGYAAVARYGTGQTLWIRDSCGG